jgi:hypothetical protein
MNRGLRHFSTDINKFDAFQSSFGNTLPCTSAAATSPNPCALTRSCARTSPCALLALARPEPWRVRRAVQHEIPRGPDCRGVC